MQLVTDFHLFDIAGSCPADFLGLIEREDFRQVVARIDYRLLGCRLDILCPPLARRVALRAKAPALTFRHQFLPLIVEFRVVNLLNGSPSKAGLMFHQILEPGLGVELVAQEHEFMPGDVDPGKHGMNAGQASHIAAERAIEREHKGGGRHKAAILSLGSIRWIAPQGVVIADPVCPMANVVAGRLITPWLYCVLNRYAEQFPQVSETLFRDERKTRLVFWHNARSLLSHDQRSFLPLQDCR